MTADPRAGHQQAAGCIALGQGDEAAVQDDDLRPHRAPSSQKRFDDGCDGRTRLDEVVHAGLEGAPHALAGHQTEGLERTADLIGEIDGHTHQLRTSTDEVAHSMGSIAFDASLTIPAGTHELGEGLGISRVGLVALQSRRGSGMSRVQADDRHAEGLAAMIEPRRQWAGLQTHSHQLRRVAPQGGGEHLGIAGSFTTPDRGARLIDDMDCRLLVRNVEGCIMRHGSSPSRVRARLSDRIAHRPNSSDGTHLGSGRDQRISIAASVIGIRPLERNPDLSI